MGFEGVVILVLVAGAFIVIAPLIALRNSARLRSEVARLRSELAEVRARLDAADDAPIRAAHEAAREHAPVAPARSVVSGESHPSGRGAASSAVHPGMPVPSPARPALVPAEPPPLPPMRPGAASGVVHEASDSGDTERLTRELLNPGSAPSPARVIARTTEPVSGPDQPGLLQRVWSGLFGTNAIVRIGVLVLFLGLAFLLMYVWDQVHIPPSFGLTAVGLGGIAMFVIGWRLRVARPDYGLVMQGGAIGVVFLTLFAAVKLWPVIGPASAFAGMLALVVLAAMLAVRQDSMALAIFAMAGGYLTPILVSTGTGSHVILFGYYALLNVGVALVAWRRAWRPLNVLGFVVTFLVAVAWGTRSYHTGLFASTEPFLVFQVLLYLVIAVLFARAQSSALERNVDGTLVFGMPVAAFGLQAGMVQGMPYALAISSALLGLIYVGAAMFLHRRGGDRYRLLRTAFLAIGVIFISLAIPLAFSARWTAAAWAIEGAGLVWLGLRQSYPLVRAMGLVALAVAAGAALHDASHSGGDRFNAGALLARFLVTAGMLFVARQYAIAAGPDRQPVPDASGMRRLSDAEAALAARKRDAVIDFGAGHVAFVAGVLGWLWCGITIFDLARPDQLAAHGYLLFVAGSALVASAVGARMRWNAPCYASHALGPILLILLGAEGAARHPFDEFGWLAWPVAIALGLMVLRREDPVLPRMAPWRHALLFWIVVTLTAWQAYWTLRHGLLLRWDWALAALAFVPAAWISMADYTGRRMAWPVAAQRWGYYVPAMTPVVIGLALWIVCLTGLSDGGTPPLPYLPVLNPVDLSQLAALAACAIWFRGVQRWTHGFFATINPRHATVVWSVLAFVVANTVILRVLHHYADVAYEPAAMLDRPLVQVVFALAWTATALVLMFAAKRRTSRGLWFAGATLLGLVVIKLLLHDLAREATVMRIVAFIGVGVLMLVIGYLAPLPPKRPE